MSSGAGASTQTSRTVDVSTNAKAMQYLVSLGVDPSGVVIQRGAHNYAGPSCPGRGWTCTTSSRVLQIASGPPGANSFACTDSSGTGSVSGGGPPGDCVIVQTSTSGTNSATCTESSTALDANQSCQIQQTNTSGTNTATITQSVNTASGSAQTPKQYSGVLQFNGGGANSVTIGEAVTAFVNQVDPSGSQSQDVKQGVYLDQENSGSGGNTATINQSENLKAAAQQQPSLTQKQNANNADVTGATVTQNSGSGANNVTVNQSNAYIGNIQQAATGFQQQGAPHGGEAEFFTQSSTGASSIAGNQAESQTQRADSIGSLTQKQYGPEWSDPNQGSNIGDTYTVSQGSTQNASNPSTQDDNQYADCQTTGSCTENQSITQNGFNQTNTCTGPFCDLHNGVFLGEGGHSGSTCNSSNDQGPCIPSEGNGALPPQPQFPPAFNNLG
jgi:hypothetical protein